MRYTTYDHKPGTRLLKKREVSVTTGHSYSELDRRINDGRFPAPVKVGAMSVVWPHWIVDRYVQEALSGKFAA
jgi:predicted DNA-binding transcriptional regulator AlpA